MEVPQPEPVEKREPTGLYRERVTSEDYIARQITEIDRLSRGEGVLELTADDKQEALDYEARLEEQYSFIYDPVLKTTAFDLGFLATEDGRRMFEEQTGVPDMPDTAEEIASFLYENTEQIAAIEIGIRKELTAAGTRHRERVILESLINQVDEQGNLVSTSMEVGEKISLVLNPDVLAQKLKGLRELKTKLKKDYQALSTDNASLAKKEIINLYVHRLNLGIVSLQGDIRAIEEKADIVGYDALSEDEQAILGARLVSRSQEKRERDTSRYDKFKFGADTEYVAGERRQVGPELQRYAEEIGEKWLESVLSIREKTKAMGLDYEKLSESNIEPEIRKEIVEEHLKVLGVFQGVSEEDEESEKDLAPDKFHARVKKGVKAASVTPKKRVINIPDKPASIITALSVEAVHEVGHALQTINGSRIPLKIFETIGGGGDTAFSEGGAMAVQTHITKEIFGYEGTSHPHYVRAMTARQNGATYPETVRVFYQSAIEPYQILLARGQVDRLEFDKQVKSSLELAINRCQRLFRGGRNSSNTDYLLSSKDTAYVDQLILAEKLAERGKEKLLLIRGMSFENIITLLKLDMLKTEDILEPDYEFIKSVWEKEKPKYVLEEQLT